MLTIKTGVLLLAHGSRREEANEEIRALAWLIQAQKPEAVYEVAYMSFGTPDIGQGVENLARQGVETMVVMPLFLTTGNHITYDIPEALAAEKERYPGVEFIMAQHLAGHPALVDVVLERTAACLNERA